MGENGKLNKRILATLCVTIFVLSAIATVNQVSAHYTLGEQLPGSIGETLAGGLPVQPTSGAGNGNPRYHIPANGWDMGNLDWAGHIPGHIAFARPGTLYVPPSDQFNYYSPDGAVLTDTVGDIFFYICVADEYRILDNQYWDGQSGPINISWRGETEDFLTRTPFSLFEPRKYIYIAIPPEFTPPVDWEAGWGDAQTTNQGFGDTSNIETTITNDHQFIETGKFGSRHPVAPNWWFVRITSDPTYHPAAPEIRDDTGAIIANPLYSLAEHDNLNQHFFDTTGQNFNFKYVDDPVYAGSAGYLYPPGMDPWLDRQISPANTNGDEAEFAGCYRVKIMNMKAPSCAGKYFFKVFYTGTLQPYFDFQVASIDTTPDSWALTGLPTGGIPDRWQAPGSPVPAPGQTGVGGEAYDFDPWSGYLNGYFEKYDSFWPENYPVILVKGEVDPGYISGTVRYCGHSQYYYGQFYGEGVHTSGKVVAEGTALDPITNEPTGRPVCAVGWFLGELPGQEEYWKDRETGSQGFYEIEGVAPGVYTLTAHAAGFVPRTLATQITVKRGQSLNGIDIYVCPTAKLQTKVYSKCPTGPVDWPEYVTLDGWPTRLQTLPVVPGGADVRGAGVLPPDGLGPADGIWYWWTEGAQSVQMKNIWADMMSRGLQDLTYTDLVTDLNTNYVTQGQMDALTGRYGWAWQELVDANGTIVAWQDFTFDIAQDARTFGTFWGDPSCYSGIESQWDGHVPTFLADFTSGLIPGSYRVRTWVFGYVQTREYVVDFPAVEFPGTAYIEMDLFKGGTINATVHFHNQELPSAEGPPASPTGFIAQMIIEAVDANGVTQAWNATDDFGWQGQDNSMGVSLMLIGKHDAWSDAQAGLGPVRGMPEGTYTIKAYLKDYVQQEFPQHTVQYCTNGTLSFHMVLAGVLEVTVYSRDCQDPTQPVDWAHPGETVMVDLCSSAGSVFAPDYAIRNWGYQGQNGLGNPLTIFAAGGTFGLIDSILYNLGVKPHGLPTDIYTVTVRTPGYVQLQFPEVWVQKGSGVGDTPVYLLVGPEIRVVVDFKTELLPAPLPKDFFSYYFRIEAFDENGTLAAANITAVPYATYGTYSQYPWPGALNPAQPTGVQTWVFQLHGFGPFTTVSNSPNWGRPWTDGFHNGANFWQTQGYNDGGPKTIFCLGRGPTGDHENDGIMWGKTYTIVVTEENQIGYIQLSTVTATPTCKGITTVIFEMDRMARISGFAYTRNYMGDFRAGSWQTVTAAGASASLKAWGPYDGYYYTYVQPDTYTVTAEGPGYVSASRTVVSSWGGVSGGQDFYLEESGIPIPEFPAAGLLALVSALAASLYLLRRRTEIVPVR
jgi:hypothetical protein